MILWLFPLKPANKIVCFDLIFYVFFFFNQYFVPYWTESNRIGPYRTKSGPISDRFRSNRATLKKKKFVHGRTAHPCKSNSGVPAKSAHWCFLGILFVAASTVPPQICIQEPDYPTTTVPQ